MRSIQEIFNIVIESGIYNKDYKSVVVETSAGTIYKTVQHDAMCPSMQIAADNGLIRYEEYKLAKKEIDDYLKALAVEVEYYEPASDFNGFTVYLESALEMCKMKSHFSFRKSIYLNWDKRPNLALIYRQTMQAKQNIPY